MLLKTLDWVFLKAISTCCFLICLGLTSCVFRTDEHGSAEIVIYAAASTTELIQDAAALYSVNTGTAVNFEFGSSGSLARKIEAGAPADLYISANKHWIEYVDGLKLIKAGSRKLFARNRLVCVVPKETNTGIKAPTDLTTVERLAVGDPEHVPAGQYAKQSLEYLGLWNVITAEDKLVLTFNVRAALSCVEQGEIPAGIVYSTDARLSEKVEIAFTLPEHSHEPIGYYASILTQSDNSAEAESFIEFLSSQDFLKLIEKHGFTVP